MNKNVVFSIMFSVLLYFDCPNLKTYRFPKSIIFLSLLKYFRIRLKFSKLTHISSLFVNIKRMAIHMTVKTSNCRNSGLSENTKIENIIGKQNVKCSQIDPQIAISHDNWLFNLKGVKCTNT